MQGAAVFAFWTAAGLGSFHLFSCVCSSFRRHKLCKFLQLWEDNWATPTGTWSKTILCNRICRWWRRVSCAEKMKSGHLAFSMQPVTYPPSFLTGGHHLGYLVQTGWRWLWTPGLTDCGMQSKKPYQKCHLMGLVTWKKKQGRRKLLIPPHQTFN